MIGTELNVDITVLGTHAKQVLPPAILYPPLTPVRILWCPEEAQIAALRAVDAPDRAAKASRHLERSS